MSDTPVVETPKLELIEAWEVTLSPGWTGKLIEALAKAQLKFKPVLKQVENAAFTRGARISKYADLAEYIDATQSALAEQGLVVTQWPDVSPEAKSMSLVSYLMHSSGEWMRGKLTLPAIGRDGFTPQSCGSSITYARRYSYAAITGCASEDDDGNAASGRGSSEAAQAVGEAKIASLKKKASGEAPKAVDCLFYVEPASQNGHFVEFVNIKEYIASHQDTKDSLRLVFTTHKAKKTKDDTVLVPAEEVLDLCTKLDGDVGIKVRKLEAR